MFGIFFVVDFKIVKNFLKELRKIYENLFLHLKHDYK